MKPGNAVAATHDERRSLLIRDVSHAFGEGSARKLVLEDVTLEVQAGEFVAFVGPSGCGKSTLLNLIAGLFRPDVGEVRQGGMTIEGVNRDVGYMTQDDALLPWRSVRSNVGLPLELRHHRDRRAQRAALVREHVRLVGLGGFEDYRPGQLSGGMRKRVALARTLICDPSVLLLDEPFAALDAQLRVVMQTELARLNSIKGKTVLLVTHDIAEAISLADRILVFSSRPARIVSEIAVDFERPRDIVQLQGDPRFGEIHKEVWDCLRPQLAASESSVAA